jgi:hypothetical protein
MEHCGIRLLPVIGLHARDEKLKKGHFLTDNARSHAAGMDRA